MQTRQTYEQKYMLKYFTWGPVSGQKYHASHVIFTPDTPQVFYCAYISVYTIVLSYSVYIIASCDNSLMHKELIYHVICHLNMKFLFYLFEVCMDAP